MGNCLERSRRGRGGGEHYNAKKRAVWAEEKVIAEKKKEEETCKDMSEPPLPPPTDRVKIRITRKQLEELLRRVDDGKRDGAVPVVREVISDLLCDASASSSHVRHRWAQGRWRPSLQSIPE